MAFSVRQAFQYPFLSPKTKRNLLVLVALAFVPFAGSFLVGHFATALVSIVTIERDEGGSLGLEELTARFLRALLAGLVAFLYMVPALVGFGFLGFTLFEGGDVTVWTILLALYVLLIASAWPLATIHAVSTKKVWNAFHLPKLLWIGLKMDMATTLKLLAVSALLFLIKAIAWVTSSVGLWFLLLIPIEGYSEYVFQYALAKAYARATEAR